MLLQRWFNVGVTLTLLQCWFDVGLTLLQRWFTVGRLEVAWGRDSPRVHKMASGVPFPPSPSRDWTWRRREHLKRTGRRGRSPSVREGAGPNNDSRSNPRNVAVHNGAINGPNAGRFVPRATDRAVFVTSSRFGRNYPLNKISILQFRSSRNRR